MSEPVDDFLIHYGVKGMRWGKRQSNTGEPRPKMSREKKVAIAVGAAATVAVGAAVAYNILNGGKAPIDIPVQTLSSNKTTSAGKANSIFGAASSPTNIPRSDIASIPVLTMTTNKTMMAGKANLIFNAASMAARDDVANVPVGKLTTNKTMLAGKANLIFSAAAMQQPVPPAPKRSLVDKAKEKGFDTAKSVAIKKLQNTSYDDFTGTPAPRNGIRAKAKGAIEDKTNDIIIRKIASTSAAKVAEMDAAKKKKR